MITELDTAMDFADDLVKRALTAGADAAQVSHTGSERFEINFETDGISLLRSTVGDSATLTVFRDGKKGSASLNGRDDAEIADAVRSALAAARAGVSDPANRIAEAPSQPPARYGTDSPDCDAMLDAVLEYLDRVAERYPNIILRTNAYSFVIQQRSFSNSRGVRQQERRGSHELSALFCGKDGANTTSFNYTGAASYQPFSRLLEAGAVRRLLDETLQAFDPRPAPAKFVGDVIITPSCMSTLIGTLAGALNGYALLAETTPYKDRIDEPIASPCFNLLNRPRSEAFPGGAGFDDSGVPSEDLNVVSDGVLKAFLIDFYIANKLGLPQTAGMTNFVVPGGEADLESLIKNTERGIVLSRFSGGRPNNNLDFSGVAKNSFYVEDGAIRFPLIETMVAGNFQELLNNIRTLSRETVNFGGSEYPYLAAAGVTIVGG